MRSHRDPPSDLTKFILEMRAKRRANDVPDTSEAFVRWLMNLLDEQNARFLAIHNEIAQRRRWASSPEALDHFAAIEEHLPPRRVL